MQANTYKHKVAIKIFVYSERETEDKERPGKKKEQEAVRPDVRILQGGRKAEEEAKYQDGWREHLPTTQSTVSLCISITGTDRDKEQNQLAKALHAPSSEI